MRSAIVTGGRKGLGFALVNELGARGWQVFSFSRNVEALTTGRIHWYRADVTDKSSLDGIAVQIARMSPSIDLLVNNAGQGGAGSALSEVSTEEVVRQFNVHCVGALRCVQAFAGLLSAARSPVVLNITSRFGSSSASAEGEVDGSNTSYGYRIAKAAQNMLTQCLAHDPTLRRTCVAAVNPGRMITDSAAQDANVRPESAAMAICDLLDAGSIRHGTLVHAFGERVTW